VNPVVDIQQPLAPPGLRFDPLIPSGGYQWWYVDAFSDDGQSGLTVIVFIGSVFSPYYARARQTGNPDAENFCSVNAIFYGPDRKRWAMTERGKGDVTRNRHYLQLASSGIDLKESVLQLSIDEVCVPFPSRLRGVVRVDLGTCTDQCFALDEQGQHRWWPVSPRARVSVELDRPNLAWQGSGYVDCNAGTVPLESTFSGWHWTRTDPINGESWIFYNRESVSGAKEGLTLRYTDGGGLQRGIALDDGPPVKPTPIWRCARPVARTSGPSRIIKTLEDTPFYARSKMAVEHAGEQYTAMHEYVDLKRFSRPWVQRLLPFRMPRRARE